MFVLFNYYTTMEKLNTLLQDYKNWLLNEYDLKEYESDWKSFKELVQRLVKNDKIDLDKVEQEAMSWFDDESPVYWKDIRTARLIMMLSVSNNPISDLVYYLK